MNIYVALTIFSLVIVIYWVITEVFTILFRLAGLPEERARFQVISLLTGCGFTTKESEILLSSRRRRSLARITMLFGYVFNITIVSTIINVFFSMNSSEFGSSVFAVLIPLFTIVLIFVLIRIPKVRSFGDRLFEKLASRIVKHKENHNPVLLLDYIGSDSIAQVSLKFIPEEFKDVALSQSGLKKDYGILVMLVEHPGKKAGPAGADTVLCLGDKLTVFGNYNAICKVFRANEHFDA